MASRFRVNLRAVRLEFSMRDQIREKNADKKSGGGVAVYLICFICL